LFRDLIERVATRPEILSVGATTNLPLSGSRMSFGISIDGRPEASLNEQLTAEYHAVTPGYFRTMGIGLRSGRSFEWSDDAAGIPVVVINEALARQHFPNEDPLGKTMTVVSQGGPTSREIVGVVSDVRHAGLATQPRVEVYVPLSQDPWPFATVVLRTTDEAQAVPLVRDVLSALDAGLPVGGVSSIERVVSRWLAPLRFQMVLVGTFASIALMLAALGIYGVISYLVSLRTNEIGVRVALGAHPGQVFGSVVGQGIGLAAIGTLLGVTVALWATRYLSTLLFEVSPADPLVFAVVPMLVILVTALACYVPARRAVRVDPVVALREV
jgi:predicted permease